VPHSVSVNKSIRQSAKRRMRNRERRTALKNQIKRFLAAIESADVDAATTQLKQAQCAIDRAAAKKIMPHNTAARRKASMAKKLNALAASKA